MSNKEKKLVEPECGKVYEAWIEKRGEINTSFKRRWAVLFENGDLCYYEEQNADQKIIKGVVNLVNVEEIRPHPAHKGIKFNSGWQIQQKKRTYKMVSINDEERDSWIKLTQDIRDKIIFKNIEIERVRKQNESIQMSLQHINDDIKEEPQKGHIMSFLAQSSTDIANQHSLNADIEHTLNAEEYIDEEKEIEITKDEWIESEIARYSNMEQISLASLHKVATLRVKNGCFGYQYNNIYKEKKQDLIVSNEFLQIGIGPHLAINEKEIEYEDEKEHKDTTSYISHNGELRTKIHFIPSTDSFTICCCVYLMKYEAGNTIISNKYNKRGFEFMVSPNGKISAFLYGYGVIDFIEIGTNALELYKWNYVVIVVKKTNKDSEGDLLENISTLFGSLLGTQKKKKEVRATHIYVYLNGELDGKLSFGKVTDFNVEYTCNKCVIGSCIDLTLTKSLCGKISNIGIYKKRALNQDEISTLFASNTATKNGKHATFSYIPSLLKVEIPHKYLWKYNGTLYEALPERCHIKPKINASFTITAWLICTSLYTGNYEGSVIVSNLKSIDSPDIIQKQGFEILYPTKESNVLSVIVTSTTRIRDNLFQKAKNKVSIAIGSTTCVMNKAHLIAVSVDRLQDGNTLITSYINGKHDGMHRMKSVDLCGGTFCSYFGRNGDKYNKGQFKGAIGNMRYFDRALTECEIACIYVADQQERFFKKNQIVLYNDYTQNEKQQKTLRWMKGIITKCDYNDSELLLKNVSDDNSNEIRINLSQIEILNEDKVTFIDLSTLKQNKNVRNVPNNLGGLIHGRDFKGHTFKLFVGDGSVLRHLIASSSLTLLHNTEPFPIHDMQRLIASEYVDDELIINRLLEALYVLLRDINIDKTNWDYINKYIFGFDELWSDKNNFMKLKDIAKSLQSQYTKMQFDLFNELRLKDWKIFEVNNDEYCDESIECRQDGFEGGMICDLNDTLVSKEIANEYDMKVSSMLLWGRNYVMNENFQKTIASIYENDGRFFFQSGPCKTYERMMEKTIEYQAKGGRYPAAFGICDVLRCSITCCNLDDVYDALQILKENIRIIRIMNRFSKDFDSNATDGYRDLLVNVLFEDKKTNLKSISEIQFHLKSYLEIKKKQHKYEKIIRAANFGSLKRNII